VTFLRFSRDKRGYEHYYLVQPANRRGKSRPRLLYFYRTAPNVRVGREPFDEAMRRALEAQNPDIQFDWKQIVATPIPSADAELWRERRRVERAARHAANEDEAAEAAEVGEASAEVAAPEAKLPEEVVATAMDVSTNAVPAAPPAPPAPSGETSRRRRRHRRGRRGQPLPSAPPGPQATSTAPVAASEPLAPRQPLEPAEPLEPLE
jgi:hypothetical protein